MKLPTFDINLRKLYPLLKVATKVADKIPTSEDTWPQRITKVMAMIDAVHEVYGGGRSRLRELRDRYDLVERDSDTFVRIFFSTTLRDLFKLRRQKLDEHSDLIEATDDSGERFFFRETHYSQTYMDSEFYATQGIRFDKVIDRLWKQYPDGIYLSVTVEPGGWRKETEVCDVKCVPEGKLSRQSRERLAHLVKVQKLYAADEMHRCYLFFGKPGTGKSSAAALMARNTGGRALKFDATSLALIGVKEFGFLLETLRPGYLIIDDLDRAPLDAVGPRVLFMLERLKSHYPWMTVILTVNDTEKLDSAILRSGRIDIPVEFGAPEKDEVETMVTCLLEEHRIVSTPPMIERIVAEAQTDDLTHAYLNDLCVRLRYEEFDDVLSSVVLLRRLSQKSEKKPEKSEKPEQPPPQASAHA